MPPILFRLPKSVWVIITIVVGFHLALLGASTASYVFDRLMTPNIVRQFRQAPVTGEISPVELATMSADRSQAGFLAGVTGAGFSCRSENQSITCILRDDNFPCVDTFQIFANLGTDGRISAIRAYKKTNCA